MQNARQCGILFFPMDANDYAERVISYIDLLGFENYIQGHTSQDSRQLVKVFVDTLKASPGDAVLDRRTTWFSDTIVTSIPLVMPDGSPQLHGVLFHELHALALAQADIFDQRQMFVRGAVTIGRVAHEEDAIFGPAFLKAYHLEQETCFPRIEVDRELLKRYFRTRELVASHHSKHSVDFRYVRPLIRKDTNKTRYIDYLGSIETEFDDPVYYPVFVQKHRDAIVARLRDNDACIHAKFLWLAAYHNSVVLKKPQLAGGAYGNLLVPI